MNKTYVLAGIFLVLLLGLIKCGNINKSPELQQKSEQSKQEIPNTQNMPVSAADKIDLKAYSEYTKDGYPRLYEQIGQSGLDAIFKHDMESAYLVANRDDCDRVTYSAYAEDRSNYPNKVVSFVDCKNGNRFYVSGENVEKR